MHNNYDRRSTVKRLVDLRRLSLISAGPFPVEIMIHYWQIAHYTVIWNASIFNINQFLNYETTDSNYTRHQLQSPNDNFNFHRFHMKIDWSGQNPAHFSITLFCTSERRECSKATQIFHGNKCASAHQCFANGRTSGPRPPREKLMSGSVHTTSWRHQLHLKTNTWNCADVIIHLVSTSRR